MRFLADMGISWRTVEWLRAEGHDAVHLRDEGLQRMPDSEIMTKALEEKRVLLTMDLDFPALLAASGGRLPSVVVFRLSNERPENVNEKLADVLARFSATLKEGALVSVRESLVRIRTLPLKG